jgi:hypothetical protein
VMVPSGGHGLGGLDGLSCIDRLQYDTIERGTVVGLDTTCVRSIRRPAFPTTLP